MLFHFASIRLLFIMIIQLKILANQFFLFHFSSNASFSIIPKCHTTLSSHIWKLKDKGIPYEVKWSIKARGNGFSSVCRAWDLCLTEKLVILTADQNTIMLNRRDELLETCRHRRKHLLVSLLKKPTDTTIKKQGDNQKILKRCLGTPLLLDITVRGFLYPK